MTAIERASQRAAKLYRSSQFRNAYLDGARAALGGKPIESCPYTDTKGWRGVASGVDARVPVG